MADKKEVIKKEVKEDKKKVVKDKKVTEILDKWKLHNP